MNRVDDVNSLDSVALGPEEIVLIGKAMQEYDAPEMYWDEDSGRGENFRAEVAREVHNRLERCLQQDGFEGSAVAFTEKEYRVTVEALVQYEEDTGDERASDVVSTLNWFHDTVQ
jgi:hypothetical protein